MFRLGALMVWTGLLFVSCGTTKNFNAIDRVLDQQLEAWNEGDIPAFMEGYLKSDSLSFMGSRGINYGWQSVKDSYLKSYPNKEAMGYLNFTILDRQWLNRKHAFYLGKYALDENDERFGYFTLIWKKVDGEWVIVHDHTSVGRKE